jgi:MSHA type pilus biogenesis protein MshL
MSLKCYALIELAPMDEWIECRRIFITSDFSFKTEKRIMKRILLLIVMLVLASCQTIKPKSDRVVATGHINELLPAASPTVTDIPPVVQQVPIVVAPEPIEELQTFTVIASGVPVNELLFALARDARLNLDIDPSISANVSINAIDQTLPKILKRVARQVSLRYYQDGSNLVIEQDRPFIRTYRVDYINMNRNTTSTVEVATQIASTGSIGSGGGSNSSTKVTNGSKHDFWQTLEDNIALLGNVDGVKGTVISNRESGLISVRTSSIAHNDIQNFLDRVNSSARKQVLIEATVVEVTLNDEFQAGVDWSRIVSGNGWSFDQSLLAGALGTAPFTAATYVNSNANSDVSAAVRVLDSFGNVSVMSSPKIMALNNQTSILKVVDNRVYFTTTVTTTPGNATTNTITNVNTEIKTVPVGFVMNVTPYITEGEEVILNIRPTLSRILRFVNDPNPELANAGVISQIPEIQVREMESVLRVANGDTAVIGGLMQDTANKTSSGIPGLRDLPGIGFLFGTRSEQLTKTELVIFLRPRIIEDASLDASLQDFKRFLKPDVFSGEAQ